MERRQRCACVNENEREFAVAVNGPIGSLRLIQMTGMAAKRFRNVQKRHDNHQQPRDELDPAERRIPRQKLIQIVVHGRARSGESRRQRSVALSTVRMLEHVYLCRHAGLPLLNFRHCRIVCSKIRRSN